jgi:hypothetical protein
MSTFQCCMWWQDQNFDELESQHWSNLVIIYKLQSVWAYSSGIIFEHSLYCYALFFAVRLSHLVLTLCNLEQYEVDTLLSVWFSQDSARYCWVLLSVILFANQNFSWWLSQLVVVSRFCLKTLPLNTSLFEETVFEKSRVFNLSRFKISICIWWCFVRVRTFEITEWVFVRFFWNQLWLSFGVNTEINISRLVESQLKMFVKFLFRKNKFAEHAFIKLIFVVKVFPKKANMLRRDFLLLQDEHIIFFCVFSFRVDCEMYSFVENEKYICLGEDWTICVSFKINTMTWVFLFWNQLWLILVSTRNLKFFQEK